MHFADRLFEQCAAMGGPVCVGLDPVYEKLPTALKRGDSDGADPRERLSAIQQFGEGVIDAISDVVPCIKLQLACFERYGAAGWAVYEHLLTRARQRKLIVIADAKRGDIGTSSAHYAAGLLSGDGADALTINPYLGADAMQPFVDVAAAEGKGLFALVRTSNPGAEALQGAHLGDGRTVSEAVADDVAALGVGEGCVGQSGYSLLGAVVGATKPGAMVSLRNRMARQIFLVPGFGAQGGTAGDVAACFDDTGQGALVTASRSVIYAFEGAGGDWQQAVGEAALGLRTQVSAALEARGEGL